MSIITVPSAIIQIEKKNVFYHDRKIYNIPEIPFNNITMLIMIYEHKFIIVTKNLFMYICTEKYIESNNYNLCISTINLKTNFKGTIVKILADDADNYYSPLVVVTNYNNKHTIYFMIYSFSSLIISEYNVQFNEIPYKMVANYLINKIHITLFFPNNIRYFMLSYIDNLLYLVSVSSSCYHYLYDNCVTDGINLYEIYSIDTNMHLQKKNECDFLIINKKFMIINGVVGYLIQKVGTLIFKHYDGKTIINILHNNKNINSKNIMISLNHVYIRLYDDTIIELFFNIHNYNVAVTSKELNI